MSGAIVRQERFAGEYMLMGMMLSRFTNEYNAYEWCSDDAPAAIQHFHSIPLELVPRLEQHLKRNLPMIIKQAEDIRENYPAEYRKMVEQDITAMLAAPYSKRINKGFIVVDNPRKYAADPSLLLLFQYVIVLELNEIKQQRALTMANKRVSSLRPMEVYVSMLGKFEVTSAQGVLSNEDFSAEQGCNLLAYIVLNRKMSYSIGMLSDTLWSDSESDDPGGVVRSAVYRLRQALACIGLKDFILSTHGTFVLNPEYIINTDVERFDELCTRITSTSRPESRKRQYPELMKLYRGNLLCGLESNHWVLPKVSYYQNQYLQHLKKYIELLNRSGDHLEVQRVATEALTIDMYDGDIHYHMIMAILNQGGKSVARRHYKQAEQYLSEEQKNDILNRL